VSKNIYILESRPQPQNIVPPWPWPGFESRSSTLAVEAATGIEWSLSPQFVLDFEFGLIYTQTMTMNIPPPPPPEEEPKPLQKPETFASSGLGLMLQVGVYFYFERK